MKKWNLVVLLLLLVSSGLFAQSVVADDLLTNSPLYYNHTPNIARTSDGVLGVVWKSAEDQIVYSEYDNSFQTWSPATVLSNAGDEASKAGISSDADGNLYVAWQQRDESGQDFAIYFTKKSAGTWSTPVNLTGNEVENEECGIAVSDIGTVFIAWNTDAEPDSAEFVLCITSSDGGTTWSEPVTLSSSDGIIGGSSTTSGRPYLAKATNGKMVCTWHEEPDNHPDRESFINQYDGTSWLGEMVYINTSDSANTMYPAIVVDSEDNIYMATVSFTSTERSLWLSKGWTDPIWIDGDETVLFEDTQFTKPVLAIDNNDNIYMGFRRDNAADTTYSLEEAAYMTSADRGITWSNQELLSRENYDAGYLSLAPNIHEAGVDFLWRESASPLVDDGDTTAVVQKTVALITDVDNKGIQITNDFDLYQNYPNPFNPATSIRFSLPKSELVTLRVYNLLGEELIELVNEVRVAGMHSVSLDASNIPSGMYIYQIKAGQYSAAKRMMLIK